MYMSKEDEIKDQKEHNTQAHTPLCSRKAPGCKNATNTHFLRLLYITLISICQTTKQHSKFHLHEQHRIFWRTINIRFRVQVERWLLGLSAEITYIYIFQFVEDKYRKIRNLWLSIHVVVILLQIRIVVSWNFYLSYELVHSCIYDFHVTKDATSTCIMKKRR